jgi:hypothetical protein
VGVHHQRLSTVYTTTIPTTTIIIITTIITTTLIIILIIIIIIITTHQVDLEVLERGQAGDCRGDRPGQLVEAQHQPPQRGKLPNWKERARVVGGGIIEGCVTKQYISANTTLPLCLPRRLLGP